MKLYKEEEIRRTFGFGLNEISFKGYMNAMKSIVLPPRTEPCKHESFVMDKQIKVIECKQCGLRSWVEKDHVDLFAPDLTAKWMRDKIQGGNK